MIASALLLIGFAGSLISPGAFADDTEVRGQNLYREAMELESKVPPDTAAALRLYTRSAEAGFLPAMRYLGFLLYEGKGTARNPAQAISWLRKAAGKGDAASWENLGWIYRHGTDTEKSDSLAIEAFTHAAQAGRSQSAFELAQMNERGEGTPCDTLAAIRYYEQALNGNQHIADAALARLTHWRLERITPDSALNLSKKYFYGKAPEAACALLAELLRRGATDNPSITAQAKTILAQAASLGRGITYNPQASIELYYQGATEGDPSAQFVIAELLESYPDILDDLIDEDTTDSSEKENHKDSFYWRQLALKAGVATADQAEKRLQLP